MRDPNSGEKQMTAKAEATPTSDRELVLTRLIALTWTVSDEPPRSVH
jgi:hypothetical protein